MVLDINLFRKEKGGDPDLIKESCRKRGQDETIVDLVISIDEQWRKLRFRLEQVKKEYNKINKSIAKFKSRQKREEKVEESKIANKQKPVELERKQQQLQKKQQITNQQKYSQEVNPILKHQTQILNQEQCQNLIAQAKSLQQEEFQIHQKQKIVYQSLHHTLAKIGNIVHKSVPVSNSQKDNQIIKTWGTPLQLQITHKKGACHHHQILYMIGGYDPVRGSKLAGHRGYFLKGPGVRLNQALISYGINFLSKKEFTPIQPPLFMKKQIMIQTCQLSDFNQQLYKIQGSKDQYYYLIATSEQPISAMYRKQWIQEKDLPIKYCGVSTCFRKQAGAHGKDSWGIFRVHQFQKIQQFIYCDNQKSEQIHQEMINIAMEFYQSLKLPYQVVNIVSGQLNDAASKKYDLEAWFPGYGQKGQYRQLVSCSNCTDYQSRNLQVRQGRKKKQDKMKKFVHMLNATLCATQRTICCILQNYQKQDGVQVPQVLQPYYGEKFIKYINKVPKQADL